MGKIITPSDSPGKSEVIDSPIITDPLFTNDTKKLIKKLIKDNTKIKTPPLSWNGTYIDNFSVKNIVNKFNIETFEYWVIYYQGYMTTCMIKLSKYYNQCLVDELKPLFGLNKLGTHYAKYNDKYVILTRARTTIDNSYIVMDYTLNNNNKTKPSEIINKPIDNVNIDPLLIPLISKIREIYVFRDLLGLSKSTDSSIAIRKSDELYPVSLIDSHIKCERLIDLSVSTYLPDTVFNKWFKDESPTAILKKMCSCINTNKITNIVFRIRGDIENIVKRVCGHEFADLPDMIIARISQKLQYS